MTVVMNNLEMRNVSIEFSGFKALDRVSFSLSEGTTHALTGANGAGKSTLMSVLSGSYDNYQGEIIIDGKLAHITSPKKAKEYGIHLVQQEVDNALLTGLSVAENIMLDQIASGGFIHSTRSIYHQANIALEKLGVSLDVRQRVDNCSLAQKQQILLARALTHSCRFLILDEPTAPLDKQESEQLFHVVRQLQRSGIAVVFISHRLHEVRAICEQVTILRDGQLVFSGPMASVSNEAIVERMLGHQLNDAFPARRPIVRDEGNATQPPLLEIEGLEDDQQLLKQVSFTLRRGEILGFAGMVGAGKSELCKALFGATSSQVRQARLNGQPWQPRSPAHSVRSGLALIPEERRKEGVFIDESIAMNLGVGNETRFSYSGLFSRRGAMRWAQRWIAHLGIRARGPQQRVRRLSGGNQQKVAIGKWLGTDADILIFDEPTKGVDVRAKTELFHLIDGLARDGKGVIYASGEFSELVGLCDRICILLDGRIVAELDGALAKEETLLLYATGGAVT